MRKCIAVLALFAALAVVAPTEIAAQGKGDDKGWGKVGRNVENDDDRWERREGYEYRTYDRDDRPPGWSKGKKTGWGDCGLPPGQAKKYGCRTYTYNGRPHYYYRDDQGRIIVRRPAVHDHDRDRNRDRDHDRDRH